MDQCGIAALVGWGNDRSNPATPARVRATKGGKEGTILMLTWIKIAVLGVAALLAALAANWGVDFPYRVHAVIALVFAAIFFVRAIRSVGHRQAPNTDEYVDGVIRAGVIATAFWGVAGFLVGVIIASQLAFPQLNLELLQGYGNFGRLRPLHTSAVIFAFGGNALIASTFYIVQRTTAARLFGGAGLGWFIFWGYQLFIVLAATGYLMGVTQGKEYAEPEWYVDLWLTVVWVMFLVAFMGTLFKRREPHIYVANWFLLAFIVTIAMLHLVNNISVPVTIWGSKSVQLFAGVQDAMTQWWYGHNAVGFFLTAGFLGMMYYFVPKQAERPVYQLQAVDHPLLGADLPVHLGRSAPPALHRAARLGLDPWHGLLGDPVDAVLGRHDQRPDDPVGRLGQASDRPDHPDDGRLHRLLRHVDLRRPDDVDQAPSTPCRTTPTGPSATSTPAPLGWNGMITFGVLYYLDAQALEPRTALLPGKLVSWHFWLATIGIVLYAASMWVTGIMEGLMWREVDANGFLVNAFADTVAAKYPDVCGACAGRAVVPDGGADHVLEPLDDRQVRNPHACTQNSAVPPE